MINHPHNDERLDQVVKEALEGYEAPFDASSWADMEKTLDASPKTFQSLRQWSFSLNTIIAIVALAAGALVFKFSISGAEVNPAVSQMPAAPAPSPQTKAAVTSKPPAQPETTSVASVPEETSTEEQTAAADETRATDNLANNKKPKQKRTGNTRSQPATSESSEFDFMEAAGQENGSPAAGNNNSAGEEEGEVRPFSDYIVGGAGNTDSKTSSDLIFPGEKNYSNEFGKKEKKGVRWPKRGAKKQEQGSDTPDSDNTSSTEKADSSRSKTNRDKHQPQYKADRTIFER